jgi:hypothetical protein
MLLFSKGGSAMGRSVILLLSALSIVASAPPPAQADPPPPVVRQNADQETLSAALALFDDAEIETQLNAMVLQMANTLFQGQFDKLRAEGVEVPQEITDRLRRIVFEEVQASVEAMKPTFRVDVATVYARHFTAEELRELKRIQDLPVSRKSRAVLPAMAPELMQIGMRQSLGRQSQLSSKIRELIDSWIAEQATAEDKKS